MHTPPPSHIRTQEERENTNENETMKRGEEERNRFLCVCRLYSSIRKRARRVCVCRFLLFAAYIECSVTDFCRQQQRAHTHRRKEEGEEEERRTINGRHQPSKGRVS